MSKLFKPHILWGNSNKELYFDIDSLIKLLKKISIRARQKKLPIAIQICNSDTTALLITLGGNESYCQYFQLNSRPPVFTSFNPTEKSNELISFDFMGEPSQMEKCYWIPINLIDEAIAKYLETNLMPNNIFWIGT